MKNNDKKDSIVLIGGSGRLGGKLSSMRSSIISPPKSELNILSYQDVFHYLIKIQPEIVILAAAIVGRFECEKNPDYTKKININGARNVAQVCEKIKSKLIYISTCAVFDGNKGNYTETDNVNPLYFYAETKLEAETIISKIVDDHLIIRTDFFDDQLKYDRIFLDHFCSKEHTSKIAKKINFLIEINLKGIAHIGGPRNSLFKILKPFFPDITPIKIDDSSMPDFPRDLSLSTKMFSCLESQFEQGLPIS